MTSRERVLAAASGQPVDRKPVIVWPHDEMYSDVAIVSNGRLANAATSPRIVLAEVVNPFGRALAKGQNLVTILADSPKEGETLMKRLVEELKNEIKAALASHADGIFYHLQGAEPGSTTPMEYGGHFLEIDRELLDFAKGAKINVLFVQGGPGLYVDFVSDLPADVFAWDNVQTDIELAEVRKLRAGALATAHPDADFLFGSNYGLLKQWIGEEVVIGL